MPEFELLSTSCLFSEFPKSLKDFVFELEKLKWNNTNLYHDTDMVGDKCFIFEFTKSFGNSEQVLIKVPCDNFSGWVSFFEQPEFNYKEEIIYLNKISKH